MEDTLWEKNGMYNQKGFGYVLILIVMEDTLWDVDFLKGGAESLKVLILIVMEDTLWAPLLFSQSHFHKVLILIVMEDTLWEKTMRTKWVLVVCLNPYCNGRYSMRHNSNLCSSFIIFGLNPYCNGRYSMSLIQAMLLICL